MVDTISILGHVGTRVLKNQHVGICNNTTKDIRQDMTFLSYYIICHQKVSMTGKFFLKMYIS